jgi:glycosyltransferase involved in cell wall biosynthesis
VGDGSPPETVEKIREKIEKIHDDRISFANIPRTRYPEHPLHRWQCLAVPPTNRGLELATGEWITFLDEDDEYYPERIQKLIPYTDDYDFIYHQVEWERLRNRWQVLGSYPPRRRHITRMAMMYHAKFKEVKLSMDCWMEDEVSDWNQIKKIIPKAKIKFVEEVLGKHYVEKTQWK